MAYKLEDFAKNGPALPGDLDRSRRRARNTLSPARRRKLQDVLDREDAKSNEELVAIPARLVRSGRTKRT